MRWKVPQEDEIKYKDVFLWLPYSQVTFEGYKYWGCWVTKKYRYSEYKGWIDMGVVAIGKAADAYNLLDKETAENKKENVEEYYEPFEPKIPIEVSHEELEKARERVIETIKKIKKRIR